MLDLFVAAAEQEIACHTHKGCGAKPNASHFIRANVVVVVVSIVPIMIFMIFSLYAKGCYKNDQTGQQE